MVYVVIPLAESDVVGDLDVLKDAAKAIGRISFTINPSLIKSLASLGEIIHFKFSSIHASFN